jgi:hypothetical protein
MRQPAVPIADRLVCRGIQIEGFGWQREIAIFHPCQRICTSIPCSHTSSAAMRKSSTASPLRSETAFAATHLARNGKTSRRLLLADRFVLISAMVQVRFETY